MSFVSAYHERSSDRVLVWERTPQGRRLKPYPAPYFFYVPDSLGDHEAVTGERVKRLDFPDRQSFDDACLVYSKRFESDLNPLEKVMTENYAGLEPPTLVIGFIDIEVDYNPEIGWSSPLNPYAPINALTLYRSDLDAYFTLAVPPPGWVGSIPTDVPDNANIFLCKNERELLVQYLDLIDDVDVLSGWNSEFFDNPYIGKRIELVLGPSALRRLAFEKGPTPRWAESERFKGSKDKDITLDLMSRVHLDYMRLFKKFNLERKQSYALGSVAEEELTSDGVPIFPKLKYEGSLYDLYRKDFDKFVRYNLRDVEIIVELDRKFKYINLANSMVHEATVNFSSIFGSVQLIDTAIINFAHTHLKKIVFDREHRPGVTVEGALVLTPTPGLHRWAASCDINSLYPSTERSLNLSPEKIVGCLEEYEEGWRAVYEAVKSPSDEIKQNREVTLRLEESGDHLRVTVGDLILLLRERKFAISAYGLILDQSNGEGLVASVLSFWFKDRKRLQAEKKKFAKEADAILEAGVRLTPEQQKELAILLES